MGKLLVITNDFPPRTGGIQNFLHGLLKGIDPAEVVVLCSNYKRSREFDAAQSYPVIRIKSKVLLPTKKRTAQAVELVKEHECDRVLFGASAPLGLMSPALRAAGVKKIIALTHGHEAGWSGIFFLRPLLKKIFKDIDVVTYLGEYTRKRLQPLIGKTSEFVRLTPGVDTNLFHPRVQSEKDEMLKKYGLMGKQVIFCVSRLMPRKGQDHLIEIWPKLLQRNPNAHLVISGGGPYKRKLLRKIKNRNLQKYVTFLGRLDQTDLAKHYGMSAIFAMPNRTRLLGLDVEGLGMVYLEAAACGIPTLGGLAGGVPDALVDQTTGFLINPNKKSELISRLDFLLQNPQVARQMGEAGRDWVVLNWQWAARVATLKQLIEL
jgi:phosphatidylinositol alpha-1,6-mannosyltransferase